MRIRIARTKGLRTTDEYGTRQQAFPGVTDMGAAQVNVGIDTLDSDDIPSCVCRLLLTPEESISLGNRLIAAANRAERMALESNRITTARGAGQRKTP